MEIKQSSASEKRAAIGPGDDVGAGSGRRAGVGVAATASAGPPAGVHSVHGTAAAGSMRPAWHGACRGKGHVAGAPATSPAGGRGMWPVRRPPLAKGRAAAVERHAPTARREQSGGMNYNAPIHTARLPPPARRADGPVGTAGPEPGSMNRSIGCQLAPKVPPTVVARRSTPTIAEPL